MKMPPIVKTTIRKLKFICYNLSQINKSEKIKALRKRYDAFLEEDKKRKERNDYILERLEKMRSCITLVQVRCKGYYKDDCDYQGGVIKRAKDVPRQTYVKTDYQKTDELNILKEISQKYILIPKGASDHPKHNYDRAISGDPGHVQSPSNDMDWKSKYSILDELKREEKGEIPKVAFEKRQGDNDVHDDVKNENYAFKDNNIKTSYQDENSDTRELLPNKLQDGYDLNTVKRPNKEERNNYRNKEKENTEDLNIEATSALSAEQDKIPLDKNNDQEPKSPLNDFLPENYQVDVNQDRIYYKSNLKEENDLKNNLYEKLTEEPQPTAVCEDKYLPEEKNVTEVEIKPTENIIQAASNLPAIVNNENVNVEAEEEIPLTYSNSPEIIKNENLVIAKPAEVEAPLIEEPTTDIKEHHEYQQQESDVKPEENVEENASVDVNDEFETEQREMFYEETGSVYKQDDTNVYPEENETYANQEYSNYYEDIQKEQIYPIDINEHEETNERYDPNYEEQYANNYEATNENEYQTQEYGVDNTYNQQAYDQPEENYQEQQIQNYEAVASGDKEAGKDQAVYYDNAQTSEQYENKLGDQPDSAYTQGYETEEYAVVQEAPAIEAIEQQLDLEDKYIQNPNKSAENQDYKNDIKQTSEVKHPDVKVI